MRCSILSVVLLLFVVDYAAARYCICPKTNNPVCGWDISTYANACVAACMKIRVKAKGNCPDCTQHKVAKPCNCGAVKFSPTCVAGSTVNNPCVAACTGSDKGCIYKGVCKYAGAPRNSKGKLQLQIATPRGVANGFNPSGSMPGPGDARHDYWKALDLNYRFYESMRSGRLPKSNRVPWRGDSCLKCRGKYGEDLSGGYYEAGGSYLKMTQIIAYTTSMMAWAADVGMSGLMKAGQREHSLDAIYWGAYYLVRGHVEPNKMVAQLGHRCTDFRYFGPPELYEKHVSKYYPEENPKGTRDVAYVDCDANKGSEIAAMSAAALALGARVFRRFKYRVPYAKIMDSHAKQLYAMAKNCQGSFANAEDKIIKQNHASLFGSSGYKDDLAFAAAIMFHVYKKKSYLAEARKFYAQVPAEQPSSYKGGSPGYHFDGKFMYPAVHVLMAILDPSPSSRALENANKFVDQYTQPWFPHTERGLAYPFSWGALRVSANAAFLALMHSLNPKVDPALRTKYFRWGEWTINYMLGDSGRSYLIGYGTGNPQWMWHKFSVFPFNKPQPDHNLNRILTYRLTPAYTLYCPKQQDGQPFYASDSEFLFKSHTAPHVEQVLGALYGAPLQNDDIIFGRDYTWAEPTIDGNAGLTGALAILATHFNPK